MKIQQVWADLESHVGQEITLEGVLITYFDGSAHTKITEVVDNADSPVARLRLEASDLMERLLAHVPVYVGGRYLFRDSSRVVGRLVRSEGGYVIWPSLIEMFPADDPENEIYRIDLGPK